MTTNTNGTIHLKCGSFEKRFPLTWTQKNILSYTNNSRVLVAGPPGTGKTTVLMCKGLQWLSEGKDVLVCSIHRDSVPTSWCLHTLLSEAKRVHEKGAPVCPHPEEGEEEEKEGEGGWGEVKYHSCVLDDGLAVQNAVGRVEGFESSSPRPLCLLFDYMAPDTSERCQLALEFIKTLTDCLPETSEIWTTDWYSTVPDGFHLDHLHVPIRFTKELFPLINVPVEALEINKSLPRAYTYSSPLHATSGPDVIHLRHKGKGSDDKWPIHSEKCGRRVAKILQMIGVGQDASEKPQEDEAKADNNEEANRGEHYQYRDVLIVTRNELERGETPAFARGLEAAGIPTSVFKGRGDDDVTEQEALSDVILAPEDKVVVMNNKGCIGLDRKVVVCLTGVAKDETWEVTQEEQRQIQTDEFPAGSVNVGDTTINLTLTMNEAERRLFTQKLLYAHQSEMELIHRLTIWSRCCRQLIVVHMPEKVQGLREFTFYRDSRCVVM
ncbi:hypothetical protein ACOMHN_035544 [Nucella lapillus]